MTREFFYNKNLFMHLRTTGATKGRTRKHTKMPHIYKYTCRFAYKYVMVKNYITYLHNKIVAYNTKKTIVFVHCHIKSLYLKQNKKDNIFIIITKKELNE